jgi:hypothetical protein
MASAVTVLALIALVKASSSAALEDSFPAFLTPGRAAYCTIGLDITGEHYKPPYLFCWTPNDGFTLSMTARGRVRKAYDSHYKRLYSQYPRRPSLRARVVGKHQGS